MTADMFSLRHRVVVVTGGSRGLGRAIAEGLAAHRAAVLIASRKLTACELAAREIRESTGADVRAAEGLNTLTVAFAHAYGPKVRVNGIMPGPFLTDISKAWDLESFDRLARERIPAGRGGQAPEVAGAAIYLASDAASYTTGSIIKIDGGAAWAPA